ncbi:hypothetical protein [Kitasatospora purpeofusca]|nr:hypothetical protein OIP63_37785 [Kitasatospora purpeofusca]
MRGARSAVLTVALAVQAGGLTACGSAGSGSDDGVPPGDHHRP